jgi:hypothetical protein
VRLHVAASILASLLTLKESNWSRFPVTSPARLTTPVALPPGLLNATTKKGL